MPDPSRLSNSDAESRLAVAEHCLDMAGIGIWIVDVSTGDLSWSDQVFRIHDLPVGETPSVEEAVAFYPGEAAETISKAVEASIAGHGPFDHELPLVTATGRAIHVHARGDVERDEDGEVVRLYGLISDVTERVEAAAALRKSERRLALALEGARDGLWDWNLETDEVHYSWRWKDIIGYADDEIVDDLSEWASRVPDEDRMVALMSVDECVRGVTQDYKVEFRMRHKDGSYRWILARGKAIERDDKGVAKRMIGTHTDITDEVELRKALEYARDSAEAAARAKSEFLATMSHEIRTPMNGVLGLTEILLRTELDDDQREYAQAVFDSGKSLLELLNDILDLSKAEAGKLSLEAIPMNPAECAKNVVTLLRVQANAKEGLALDLHVADTVPEWIVGDPVRLKQLLFNLVGNAIKFTASGRVDVHVDWHTEADGAPSMSFEVRDTGIGIAPEQRSKLFQPFTQADASTTRKFGGTGLGLSICRHIAKSMSGTIDCESNEPRGSIFRFTFYPDIASAPPKTSATETRESFDGAGRKVLVAEDNPINQLVSQKILEGLGFEVDIANNGEEAVRMTANRAYSLVFMDCQMPQMDGFEATRQIRARCSVNRSLRLPIIAMTANVLPEDEARCRAAGMDDHVDKPIQIEQLVAAIARALENHDLLRQAG